MSRLIHITTVPHTLHFLIGQIGFMRRRGLEVAAISSVDEKLDYFLQHEPIEHFPITMRRSLSPLHDLGATARLVRLLQRQRPKIVHAHTPKAGLLGMLSAWITGVPVRIYHIHGLRFSTLTGWKRQLLIACEKLACRLATTVLCVSQSARNEAIDAGIVAANKVEVLLHGSINGMDAVGRFNPAHQTAESRTATRSRLGIPPSAVVAGFIGRLAKDKGIDELAIAWQQLRCDHPDLHLLLVGDYEPNDPVAEATRVVLESDDRVHRVAYDPETPRLFAAMDIFCLPTYREGLPYVILEASAMQLPIVATRVTGCVDAVEDGVTGYLVEAREPLPLRRAISDYANDPWLRRQHGVAGRRHVLANFDPPAMWHALWDVYRGKHTGRKIDETPIRSYDTKRRARQVARQTSRAA